MDSLGSYLHSIGKIPLLTASEEIVLGREVKAGLAIELEVPPGERTASQKRIVKRGQKAKKRMIEANLRLVVSVAKKYMRFGMEMMDLIQEGSLGLNRAVEKFDSERGYKFSTYAYWWIRQAMTRALDTQSRAIRLPLHLSEIHLKIRRRTREVENLEGRKPTYQELADYLGRPVQQIREVIQAFTPISSLDKQTPGEDRSAVVDLIADPRYGTPDDVELEDAAALNEVYLSRLNPRELEVVVLTFGIESGEPLSLSEVSRQIANANGSGKGVSRERIRQIRDNALMKMRYFAGSNDPKKLEKPAIAQASYQPALL